MMINGYFIYTERNKGIMNGMDDVCNDVNRIVFSL